VSATTFDIMCSGVATTAFVQAVAAVRSCVCASASHGAVVRVRALIGQRAPPAANARVAHAICVAVVDIAWPQIRVAAQSHPVSGIGSPMDDAASVGVPACTRCRVGRRMEVDVGLRVFDNVCADGWLTAAESIFGLAVRAM
jgi:hypothetical protein